MQMAQQHLEPITLSAEDLQVEPAFTEKIEAFKFNEAMDLVWEHVAKGDAYMTSEEPYKKIKTDPEAAKKVLEKLVRHLAKLAVHLAPAMPATADAILAAVRTNTKPENLFPRLS
jgi:methionyl-tRNA synthetase